MLRQISKKQGIGGACLSAGSICFSILQPFAITKITLVDCLDFPVIITGIVWTCCHAGLAADTQRLIHHNNTILFILVSGLGRADADAGRTVAMIAENREKLPYHFTGGNPGYFAA
jgi:hypothetical protein